MTSELLVFTLRPVASGALPLQLGEVELHELIHGTTVDPGFPARHVLVVSPASMVAHSVAVRVASALAGVVIDPLDGRVCFDARDSREAPDADLATLARDAHDQAVRAWAAIELAHEEEQRSRAALLAVLDDLGPSMEAR